MKRSLIVNIISALLVFLFVYAASSKLLDYRTFKLQLAHSPLIGSVAPVLSIGIPAVELLIAGLLIRKATRLQGLFASMILLSLFTVYLTGVLGFSKDIPCSCGGILKGLSWNAHIIFNLAFIVLAVIGNTLQWRLVHEEHEPGAWSVTAK